MDTHEENGGTACSGLSSEQQNCNTGTCPAGTDYYYAIHFNVTKLVRIDEIVS